MDNIYTEHDQNEFPPIVSEDNVSFESEEEAVKKKEKKLKNAVGKKTMSANATVIQRTKKGYTGVSINGFGVKFASDKTYNVGDKIEIR